MNTSGFHLGLACSRSSRRRKAGEHCVLLCINETRGTIPQIGEKYASARACPPKGARRRSTMTGSNSRDGPSADASAVLTLPVDWSAPELAAPSPASPNSPKWGMAARLNNWQEGERKTPERHLNRACGERMDLAGDQASGSHAAGGEGVDTQSPVMRMPTWAS